MKVQTKISKNQYKAILERALNRTPAAEQQSQALNMQGMMGPQASGMGLPTLQGRVAGIQGVSVPTGTQAPMMPMPASLGQDPQTQAMAAQAWAEIKDTVGGALWARLSRSPSPDQAFIEAATQYLGNPEAIVDPRVKSFMAGVFPPQPQDISQQPKAPQEDPLTSLIMSNLR